MPKADKKPAADKAQSDPKPQRKRPPSANEERPVLYPTPTAEVKTGENAITVEWMREKLGWDEETEERKFGDSYDLIDREGRKVRLLYNLRNRPLYRSVYETYVQSHLTRQWPYNGEAFIVGKTGIVVNGQHQGVAMILAEQDRVGPQAARWALYGEGPITMEKLVSYGVDETDAVVNTIDTGKGRSPTDMLYRSEYFSGCRQELRKTLARATDYSIRFLWHRTGADKDAFSPHKTYPMVMDFLERHPRVIKLVKHVVEEDKVDKGKGPITRYLGGTGYAAGMCYLMGCSASDETAYADKDGIRRERRLDWSLQDKAEEFWVALASSSKAMSQDYDTPLKAVCLALGALGDPENGTTGSLREKTAVIALAWRAFADRGTVAAEDVSLSPYLHTDGQGIVHLKGMPTFGGIDLPEPVEDQADEEDADPTPEQVEEAKAKIQEENTNGEAKSKKGKGSKQTVEPSTPPADSKPLPPTMAEELAAVEAAHPGRLLLFRVAKGFRVWGLAADKLDSIIRCGTMQQSGMTLAEFPATKFLAVVAKLEEDGLKPLVIVRKDKQPVAVEPADYKA